MSFLHPLGLLALLSVPAVLAIHFFRRRYKPRPIAGLFLWPDDLRSPATGRRWTRLVRSVSLLLELLAVLAASLLVAGLFLPREAPVRHLTIVVDGSASMGAIGPDGSTSLARATLALAEGLDEDGRLRVAVLVSGTRPSLHAGPALPLDEAIASLGTLAPDQPTHSLLPAIDLARQMSGPGGAIRILTDDPDRAIAASARVDEIVARGLPLGNLGLGLARRMPSGAGGGSRIYLVVRSFADGDAATRLSILQDGVVTAEQDLTLAGGASRELAFELGEEVGRVEVRLSPDALAIDNSAVLEVPRSRVLSVACTVGERRVASRIEKACRAAPAIRWRGGDPTDAHILVVDGEPPVGEGDERTWRVGFGGVGEGEPLAPLVGPYLTNSADPVVGGLDFRGVIWGGARPWEAVAGLRPVLLAGERMLVARRTTRPDFLFNLDPTRSNIHKSPAWPLFWNRLIEGRRARLPGLDRSNYASGERPFLVLERRAGVATRTLVLAGPGDDGPERTVKVGSSGGLLPQVGRPGAYRVLEDGAVVDRYAVHFDDPTESDLRRAAPADPGQLLAFDEEAPAIERTRAPWLWPLLLGLVALASIGNWFVLSRGG